MKVSDVMSLIEARNLTPEVPADKGQVNKNQLVYCPTYYVVSKKNGELNILKSDHSESSLYGHIKAAAQKAGVGSIDFSDQSLHNITSADRYNEWVDLNEWIGEFWKTKGDFDMQFSVQPQMDRIVDKYDAGTLNMTIVLNRENLTERVNSDLILYGWFLPILPIAIEEMFTHTEATLVYSVQIDARQGKRLSKHVSAYSLSDENARIRSALYDHYLHIDTDSVSRVPGYMGSRLNFAVTPTVGIGNIFAERGESSFLRGSVLSFGIGGELEYIVGRKRSLRLSANYIPTSLTTSNTTCDVNDLIVSLAWRVYKNPAPLGYYWQFGGDFAKVSVPQPPDALNVSANMAGMHLQFGRNFIFSDHVLFGYFLRYGFLFGNDLMKESDSNNACVQTFFNNIVRIGINIGFQP